ncbi:type II toxin-antitoxin system HicB family antitoxin [Candidatus Magnetaquicoccus inordinatus]|uniref:type II toxin-antitoxin system HicB family antitoxin n=1 Tax=Candidatus Magnetaquicoccus inordinatus TaxID=2496818 RepID=UPI00102C0879|nr:type II toxin-antitoxin system HicB family antitoxin [Candidatus Magnetaquicoccus inordinatus]
MNFAIAIHKDADSDYGVTVPDLPGCFSAGGTMDEAISMAREAIQTHVEGLLLDNETIPFARPIEEHQSNPEFAGAVWAVVQVDLGKITGKSKRINITIPEPALARIDSYAAAHGESRSGFLMRAALQAMR